MKRIKTLLLIVMISLAVFAAGFAFVSVHVYHRSIGASLMELRLQSKNSTRVFETAQNAQKYMQRRAKSEDKWYELPKDVSFESTMIVFHYRNIKLLAFVPESEKKHIVLYLHGGGYVAGDLEYARGFGSVLAAKNNVRVFCAAYRLAPEHPFPAALEDALAAYQLLLDTGYEGRQIMLCGESAGGGLIYSLAVRLKELGMPLPGGLIAISPWSDLTASGKSYQKNREKDPTMQEARLRFYAECYTDEPANPLVSPLFADLNGMPPSLIFVGGDEIMLDDAALLHQKLLDAGCESLLTVTPDMWHGYILYGVSEAKRDLETIRHFLYEHLRG